MRHLATISGKSAAESFVAYLLTQDVSTHVEPDDKDQNQWEIWIRDEDKSEIARREYQAYLQAPEDPKYRQAVDEAKEILKQKKRTEGERKKLVHYPQNQGRPLLSGGGLPPLTLTIIILCVALGLISEFSRPSETNWLGGLVDRQLMFVDQKLYQQTSDPAASIKQGEVWRILTPAFLHGHPLHLLFNMLSFAMLGRITERLEGIGKFSIILLITAAGAHLLQGLMPTAWWGTPMFVGISGVILGLLGYIGTKTTLRPDLGFQLSPQAYLMTGVILFLGFFNGQQGVQLAHLAHVGGLAAGIVVGLVLSDRRFDSR
jgi:GlpG protein